MDNKDIELEVRRKAREMVVLLVSRELTKLAKEAALAAIDSMGKEEFKTVDTKPWASRIISIVKEHSL